MHYSVLLDESIELLNINPDGIYIDGTFGRGGHTKEILAKLSNKGRLIAFDKDIVAVNHALELKDKRLEIIHDSFAKVREHLKKLGIERVDGILLDLGVSSPQLDVKERGFSFRLNGELDMRMDNTKGINARQWINQVAEDELAKVLWQYSEERFSRKIAHNIVIERAKKEITTTNELAKIISDCIPFKEKGQHPATRSFQAIRIFINNELGDLEAILSELPLILNHGARVVVISFHSLEDRIVKNKFNELASNNLPKWVVSTDSKKEYRIIAKKIRASIEEISKNKRSKSGIMRCLERI